MMVPKGVLIPIGGNEAKGPEQELSADFLHQVDFFKAGILKEVLQEVKQKTAELIVEIVPAASKIPEEVGKIYIDAFKQLGCKNVNILQIHEREEADSKKNLKKLSEANLLFFTGGDQAVLVRKIGDTKFAAILQQRYMNEDLVIAGTSAGAMAMSKNMIREGYGREAFLKGIVSTGLGLSLLPHAIIDTHFMTRGRLTRLTEALVRFPDCVAFGISEDTAMIITEGNKMKAIGSGVIVIMEGDEIKNTNYNEVNEFQPVFIENLKLHILAKGATYLMKERRLIKNED